MESTKEGGAGSVSRKKALEARREEEPRRARPVSEVKVQELKGRGLQDERH
jgi:hypothetical protein